MRLAMLQQTMTAMAYVLHHDQVATWHIADLDKAIDALSDAAADYDRDGLRAVAHLGGVGGMKQYVQTKGEYNPADELGTSLKSYYDKFSAS